MTIQELQTRKEGQTFDCKSIQIDPKALAVPIVAMANVDGGVIAIGVSDKTRTIEGGHIYREHDANGTPALTIRTDDSILKISVPKVAEEVSVTSGKVDVNVEKVIEKVTVNRQRLIEKLIERATINGDKLTKNRITILELMSDNPYITIVELAKEVGISDTSIMRNIDYMRGKFYDDIEEMLTFFFTGDRSNFSKKVPYNLIWKAKDFYLYLLMQFIFNKKGFKNADEVINQSTDPSKSLISETHVKADFRGKNTWKEVEAVFGIKPNSIKNSTPTIGQKNEETEQMMKKLAQFWLDCKNSGKN